MKICSADRKMDKGFALVDARFEKFDKKFDRLMWGLLAAATTIVTALLGLIGTLIGTQAL